MYEKITKWEDSADLCRQVAEECDTAILAFSTGKDSIATWLQLRKYFKRVVPYYCICVPGLQFVERSLRYYEDFFETHIIRVPHPSFYRQISCYTLQPPDRLDVIKEDYAIEVSAYTQDGIRDMIRKYEHLNPDTLCAVGIRSADSLTRRVQVDHNGAIQPGKKLLYAIYDWLKADMLREFYDSGVKLPVDYRMFGRSFDGLNYQYLKPIHDWFPEDYEQILRWFPLAELELARFDGPEVLRNRREVMCRE